MKRVRARASRPRRVTEPGATGTPIGFHTQVTR